MSTMGLFIMQTELPPVIPRDLYEIYFWPKFSMLLISYVLALIFYLNPTSKIGLWCTGFIMNFATMWAALFRPDYHVSYFQCFVGFAFAEGVTNWIFFTNAALGAVGCGGGLRIYLPNPRIFGPSRLRRRCNGNNCFRSRLHFNFSFFCESCKIARKPQKYDEHHRGAFSSAFARSQGADHGSDVEPRAASK